MTLQEQIGLRVRHLRMEHHWTARTLARLVDWQPDYLSRFEHGKWSHADPAKLCLLARHLDISVDRLLAREPEHAAPLARLPKSVRA